MKQRASIFAAMALVMPAPALVAGCSGAETAQTVAMQEKADRPTLGLMTTLPILWAEGDDFGDMLSADAETHWVLDVLAEAHDVAAMDTLTAENLAPLGLLVLAQPRMLSPAENVALDEWVRTGGHVLMFADPMLTGHSQYGIGDKRRPQDVALLDTILARWGLTLEAATPRLETVFLPLGKGQLPVEAEGVFTRSAPTGGAEDNCSERLGPILMSCDIGTGHALLLADAAVLEVHENPEKPSVAALQELLAMAGNAGGDRRP